MYDKGNGNNHYGRWIVMAVMAALGAMVVVVMLVVMYMSKQATTTMIIHSSAPLCYTRLLDDELAW